VIAQLVDPIAGARRERPDVGRDEDGGLLVKLALASLADEWLLPRLVLGEGGARLGPVREVLVLPEVHGLVQVADLRGPVPEALRVLRPDLEADLPRELEKLRRLLG